MNKNDVMDALRAEPQAAALLNDKEKLKEILASSETRQVLQMLNSDGGQSLKNAIEAIGKGDMQRAKKQLEPMIEQESFAALMQQLENKAK